MTCSSKNNYFSSHLSIRKLYYSLLDTCIFIIIKVQSCVFINHRSAVKNSNLCIYVSVCGSVIARKKMRSGSKIDAQRMNNRRLQYI